VEAYRTGYGLMDSHHELLFRLIADLERKIQDGEGEGALFDQLERLYSYAAVHFAAEDRVMIESDYPDTASHRSEHESVLANLKRLEAAYRAGAISAPEDTLRFIQSWATSHIPNADRRLADHLLKCASADLSKKPEPERGQP
jgi:hemerythrin